MAPKKKGGKKQEDDWEKELGESVPGADGENGAPIENQDAGANGANNDEDGGMGGGLLAALKKNRNKKVKKGKAFDNDFVEGEDPVQANPNGNASVDLASKAPEEATFDDDDVFSGKPSKGKPAPKEVAEEDAEEGGKVKSKKEKEKEKKEREKQRKKEQVRGI
jgi:translation initiation factor 5B